MAKLVLVRHGKTDYNKDRRFCGLTDVSLNQEGISGVKSIAKKIKSFRFQFAYCSQLKRTIETAMIILTEIHQENLDVIKRAEFNERDYGDLTGKLHQETENFFSPAQVKLWRRGWDNQIPNGESLKDVYNRVIPFFKNSILPQLIAGNDIIIFAHGNSLRALIKYLDCLNEEEVFLLEISYNEPYIYEFDSGGLCKKLDIIPRERSI